MAKLTVAKKAARDMIHRAKTVSRMQDKLWNEAAKAPMFAKISMKQVKIKKGKTEKTVKREVRRAQRAIGGHSYQVAAAGVAQAIARDQQLECKRLGVPFERPSLHTKEGEDSKGVPNCQAQFSPGYKFVVEQCITAYVQECVETARQTLASLHKEGQKKRLNRKIMHLACTEVNQNTFGASALAPRDVYVVPLPKKKVKKEDDAEGGEAEGGEAEEDYQPPSAEEQAEDEAEEEQAGEEGGEAEGGD